MWSFSFLVERSNSRYLRMFDWTKDASGHAQMLLFWPGFLSFQKPPLLLTKCSLCLFFFFLLFFVRFLNCLDFLSNPVFQWIFIDYVSEVIRGIKMVLSGCKLLLLVLLLLLLLIWFSKMKNPMVCLLALWVSKFFFSFVFLPSPKTSSYTL